MVVPQEEVGGARVPGEREGQKMLSSSDLLGDVWIPTDHVIIRVLHTHGFSWKPAVIVSPTLVTSVVTLAVLPGSGAVTVVPAS